MKLYIFILMFLIAGHLMAQTANPELQGNQKRLMGKVYASYGTSPISGAEIQILPDGLKTTSADDGSFSLEFPDHESWIRITYPGYSTKEMLINSAGKISIHLFMISEKSGDNNVSGPFGSIARYKNSSYAYVQSYELAYSGETGTQTAVDGRFGGVNIKQLSGMPGEGGFFNLRGISSIFASHQPVVVLDGVPVKTAIAESNVVLGALNNPLSDIDVNDIEKIEVYPDGASLYGMYGNQGVIYIKTRQPVSPQTKVDFSVNSGLTFQPNYIPLLSGTEHKAYIMNLMQGSGLSNTEIIQQNPWITGNPSYFHYYDYDNNTDWQKEVFNPAMVNKFNATLQGGDEIAVFSVSLGYLNQRGVVKNTDYQRYNFRLNAKIKILEHLSMVANVGFAYQNTDRMNFGTNYLINPITAALLKSPMLAPYLRDQTGARISVLSNSDIYGFSNPTAIIEKTESGSYGSNLFSNAKLIYNLTNNLDISSLINFSFNNIKENSFIPNYGITDLGQGYIHNYAEEGITKLTGILNETRIDFNKNYNLTHFISASGGLRIHTFDQTFFKGTVYNTPTDEFKSLTSVTSIEDTYLAGNNKVENRSDLFVQGNYRFKDKYLFDVVLNLSGSSNVGPQAEAINLFNGKWGFFPSLHAAWLLSSEPFLKSNTFIDLLKLRASLTYSGNDFFSNYSRYSYQSQPYGIYSGLVRTYIPNEKLKWEQIRQVDLGLDASVLNEKVQLSIDAYQRNTSDMLTYREVPVISGYDYFWENNGNLTSTGIDVNLGLTAISNDKLTIRFGANLGANKSKLNLPNNLILDIPGGQILLSNGDDPFSYYGLKTDGIISSAAEAQTLALTNSNGVAYQAGDIKFVDQNNDHIINENDRITLGSLMPKLTGGFSFEVKYENLSLNVLFDYVTGNKLFNYSRMLSESFSGYGNQTVAALNNWKSDGNNTEIPRISYNDLSGNSAFSDRWIESGNYFRMKELTLAYSFPGNNIYKNLTLYATGQNLLTFSKYLGYSPEFAYSANPVLQGSDYGQMPVTPLAILGIKIGF